MKTVSVSVVIPVFNEESHLRNCLEALARQTVKPLEVIVVDNNSSDATMAIAKSFPFVRLTHEKRQGVVYARDCGFDAARGDVIGRLDGDSVVTPDWIETIQRVFADSSVDAATGAVRYRGVCFTGAFNKVDFWIRGFMARRMQPLGEQSMQGVNLAIRKSAWLAVKPYVCHERRHHEDLDLSAHMADLKQNVVFEPHMVVESSARRADAKPGDFYLYAISNPRTYRAHGMRSVRYIYPIVWAVLALYVPIRLAYRGYNPATGRFSLKCLFYPAVITGRPSPVAPSLTPLD